LLDRVHPVSGIGGKSLPADTNQLPQFSTLSDALADDAEGADGTQKMLEADAQGLLGRDTPQRNNKCEMWTIHGGADLS
jgi:hypothetical protein